MLPGGGGNSQTASSNVRTGAEKATQARDETPTEKSADEAQRKEAALKEEALAEEKKIAEMSDVDVQGLLSTVAALESEIDLQKEKLESVGRIPAMKAIKNVFYRHSKSKVQSLVVYWRKSSAVETELNELNAREDRMAEEQTELIRQAEASRRHKELFSETAYKVTTLLLVSALRRALPSTDGAGLPEQLAIIRAWRMSTLLEMRKRALATEKDAEYALGLYKTAEERRLYLETVS